MSVRDIRRHTKAELEERIARGEDRTDWARVDALTDEEIDRAARQDPDTFIGDAAFWQAPELLYPKAGNQRITLRLDTDVLEWFKSSGQGYQTRINAILRAFMQAQQSNEPRHRA